MTVAIERASQQFNGAGTASFAFTYVGAFAADNDVYLTTASSHQLSSGLFNLTLSATASGYVWGIGGTVTYPLSGPVISGGDQLTVVRNLPLLQTYPVPNQGAYPPQVVEAALDYEMMCLQDLKEQFDRTLRGTILGPPLDDLPPDRAGKCLAFDTLGQPVAVTCSSGTVGPPGPSGTNGLVKRTVFTSGSGTFTAQSTTTAVFIKIIGAGGGGSEGNGANLNNVSIGVGGNGGAYAEKWITASASFSNVTYAVGAGGAGGTGGGSASAGGSSHFGTVTASGGAGGVGINNTANFPWTGVPLIPAISASAATATGGDINISGEIPSSVGFAMGIVVLSRRGASGPMGFGGHPAFAYQVASHDPGTAAGKYGAGGSGGVCTDNGTAAAGGAGSSGLLVILEYG